MPLTCALLMAIETKENKGGPVLSNASYVSTRSTTKIIISPCRRYHFLKLL